MCCTPNVHSCSVCRYYVYVDVYRISYIQMCVLCAHSPSNILLSYSTAHLTQSTTTKMNDVDQQFFLWLNFLQILGFARKKRKKKNAKNWKFAQIRHSKYSNAFLQRTCDRASVRKEEGDERLNKCTSYYTQQTHTSHIYSIYTQTAECETSVLY